MATIIDFKSVLNQGINYNRYYIQSLIKYNKPIIVTGKFVGESNSAETKYAFTNIKPYVSEEEFDIYELTNHINIEKICIEDYYPEAEIMNHLNKIFVIVCKPYYYKDDNIRLKRASLEPTNELLKYGFPAINLLSESKSYNEIPWDKIIDFRNEFNYRFVCPKDSKYKRYSKDGVPVKDFSYIKYNGGNREQSLDDMIKKSIGYSIFDMDDTSISKKTKTFHKKSNIKSVMKASAKRRMYDLKHHHTDSLQNNYNVFQC